MEESIHNDKIDDKTRQQAAFEACFLMNEAIRELVIPSKVIQLSDAWKTLNPVPLNVISAVRHMVIMSLVVNIYRLKETRDNFLAGWLFSDEDMRTLGFPPVEEFIGKEKWQCFEIVRHQYAGHATSKKATDKHPGHIIPAVVLGKALKKTGLLDLEAFLQRIQEELASGVEKVRDELTRRYPAARQFIETHAVELENAARAEKDT